MQRQESSLIRPNTTLHPSVLPIFCSNVDFGGGRRANTEPTHFTPTTPTAKEKVAAPMNE